MIANSVQIFTIVFFFGSFTTLMSVAPPFAHSMSIAQETSNTQDQKRSKEPENETASQRAKRLVNQLGSDDFDERQLAESELRQMPEVALTALTAALESRDLEIRLRVRRLIGTFEKLKLERSLTRLINDDKGADHDLPLWDKFKQIAGTEKSARRLYVSMVRNNPGLMQVFDSNSQIVIEEFSQLMTKTYNASSRLTKIPSESDLATLLLLGADKRFIDAISETQSELLLPLRVKTILSSSRGEAGIIGAENAKPLKRLLRNWISKNYSNSNLAGYMIKLAMRYEFRQNCLKMSRQVLANRTTGFSPGTLSTSFLALGKLGSRDDCTRILPYLENEDVCHTWHNGDERIQTEVRDVALLTLVRLTEQETKKYGFDLLRSDSLWVYSEYSIGFAKDADRQKALSRWHVWAKSNKL